MGLTYMADLGLVVVLLTSHALGWPFTNHIFTPRKAPGVKNRPSGKNG